MSIGKKKPEVRPPWPQYKRFPSKLERTIYQTYNTIDNKIWPVRPLYFGAATAAIAAYHVKNPGNYVLSLLPEVTSPYMEALNIAVVSLGSAYAPVFLIRRFLKYFYFSYKGFLFENPKKPSLATKIWGIVRLLLSFSPPRLQSAESLLPKQPVPALKDTVERFLDSIKHITTKDEFALVKEQAENFLNDEGRKLQACTTIYSWFNSNYVTNFWQKFAYFYGRDPLLINSSVAHVDLFKDQPATRAFRAAHVTYIEALSHMAIDRQNYKPLGDGLLCACHYDNMYCVTRVPGDRMDHLENHGISQHICVFVNGLIYRLQFTDANRKMYSIEQLTKIFDEVLSRTEREDGILRHVAALTTDKRDRWSINRVKFFLSNPQNKAVLDEIEKSVFFLVLDENEEWDYNPEHPECLNNYLKAMLTGDGSNRWADKSLNYIVNINSRCGGTTEHSIADGSEFDHIMENFVYMDVEILKYPPVEEQKKLESNGQFAKDENLILAKKLPIQLTDEEMSTEITRCLESHRAAADDVDLVATIFRDWGKGRIKKCGCSPDGFVQMAIQLANYRDQGKFVLTYEPASVRFFKNSRTETLRTVSDESCEFVIAMENKDVPKEERIRLLRTACERHVSKNKDCMVGKGVDRHLFVLFVLSQGTGISSPFLNYYISQKWLLSTSHIPNVTGQNDEDTNPDNSWLGACFGAVAKEGYGIGYRFAGNHSICAHISSYHSAENTSSERFQKYLIDALNEMAALFD